MVSFGKLAAQAKKAVDAAGGPEALKQKAQRAIDDAGGTDALKAKAGEVRGIATGEGSLADKAKAAAEVVKRDPAEPGADAKRAGRPVDG